MIRVALAITTAVMLAGCGTGVYDDPLRPDPRATGKLDGQFFFVPCGQTAPFSELVCDHGGNGVCTHEAMATMMETVTRDDSLLFPGVPGVVYQVSLRIRGVVEPTVYDGGTPGATDGDKPGLYTGGVPVSVTDNVFRLSVSSPKQVYYLNALQREPSAHHAAYPVDYTVTIPIAAYAEIGFRQWDPDCRMIRNCDGTSVDGPPGEGQCHPSPVPGIAWVDMPYDGQFLLINVVGIAI